MVNPSPVIKDHSNDERDEKLDKIPLTLRDKQVNKQDREQEQKDRIRAEISKVRKQSNTIKNRFIKYQYK